MAIALANTLGSGTAGSGVTSVSLTAAATTTVGNHIIVALECGFTETTITVTDSKGNTYQQDVSVLNAGAGAGLTIFSSHTTSALTSGVDTITATLSSSANNIALVAYEFSGLATSGWFDQSQTNNVSTSTANPTSNATPTTTAANELLFGGVAIANSSAAPTAGTGYTALDTVHSVNKTISTEYEIVAATGTYAATWTLGAFIWAAAIATYKASGAAAPSNTVAPAVTGTTTVGQTLTTTNGTWTDSGGSVFTYQWQDSADGSTGWANIASSTSSTYVIGSGESSKYIRCVVTDTDSTTQSTAANSNVVGPIAAAPSLSTVVGKTGTGGTAVMQKAKSGWTYITGKKNTSGTAVDQKGLGGFTKIKGH